MDEQRLAEAWASIDAYADGAEFRALIDSVVADAPPGVAAFERAGAYDSTGHPDRAVPLYRAALEAGLTGYRRRRAMIQLASSLRNLGQPERSLQLLTAERDRAVGPEEATLDDAIRAVLALTLVDLGREREAASVAIGALAPHLPRYQRSMAAYARALVE